MTTIYTAQTHPPCTRCHHSWDWHQLGDIFSADRTKPPTAFRCLGFDPDDAGRRQVSRCTCSGVVRAPS